MKPVGISDPAYAACDAAYQLFGAHTARVYRYLSALPDVFDLETAATRAQLADGITAAAVEELLDAGMLNKENEDSYRWVPVAKQHAADTARKWGIPGLRERTD